MSRFFQNLPWMNNVQQAVDTVVDDISRAAEDVAGSFRSGVRQYSGQRPAQQTQNQGRRQQQQPPPPFPFHFQQAQSVNPQQTPPASSRAIRQLPTILVAPENLVDESNRECCICLSENCLGAKVTRLPCAHIFHTECIIDWLQNQKCTCPICRYELPTDDPMYETGRAERMRARKPRFAQYELNRMSIKELVALNRGRAIGIGEKKDLIQNLIDTGAIDLIPAPEPVEYKLSDLQNMKVSRLKKTMTAAGVFFHGNDVVEKCDMITIFVNSGRLNLIPDDMHLDEVDMKMAAAEKASLPTKRPLVETVDYASDDDNSKQENDRKHETPVVMFPSVTSPNASRIESTNSSATVDESLHASPLNPNSGACMSAPEKQLSAGLRSDEKAGHAVSSQLGEAECATFPSESALTQYSDPGQVVADTTPIHPGTCSFSDMSIDLESPTRRESVDEIAVMQSPVVTEGIPTPCDTIPSRRTTTHSQLSDCPLSEYTVAQLLRLGREGNVDLSSCFERSEMVDLLVSAGVTGRARVDLQASSFAEWSISQLRAIASEVNIDLSNCSDQTEIVEKILIETNTHRPYLRNYLRVLAPLTTSNLSQLRATARDWDVDISDCLEKDEIIQRLVTRANQFGIC